MSSADHNGTEPVQRLVVEPMANGLRGRVPVAADDWLTCCRLALCACARGVSTLEIGRITSGVRTLLNALQSLGLVVHWPDVATVTVTGGGLFGVRATDQILDVRGEPGVAALLLGLLVGREFPSELWVDSVVADLLVPLLADSYPLQASPLESGVSIGTRPVSQRGPGVLASSGGVMPWVKPALLLAGLRASTPTTIEETFASADHLERALLRARLPIEAHGTVVTLHPPRDDDALAPQRYTAVGSPTLAAYLGAAALTVPESRVEVASVGLNPTRSDFVKLCRLLGAQATTSPAGDHQGEPVGSMSFVHEPLRAAELGGENVVRLADSFVPLLLVAARASGRTVVTDLVTSGSDRDSKLLGRLLGLIRSVGVRVEQGGQFVSVAGEPSRPLKPLTVTTGGDARLALAATILALSAEGPSFIDDVECLRLGFPRFIGTLRALGCSLRIE